MRRLKWSAAGIAGLLIGSWFLWGAGAVSHLRGFSHTLRGHVLAEEPLEVRFAAAADQVAAARREVGEIAAKISEVGGEKNALRERIAKLELAQEGEKSALGELGKVLDQLAPGRPLKIGGKSFDAEDARREAELILHRIESRTTTIKELERRSAALASRETELSRLQDEHRTRVLGLELALAEAKGMADEAAFTRWVGSTAEAPGGKAIVEAERSVDDLKRQLRGELAAAHAESQFVTAGQTPVADQLHAEQRRESLRKRIAEVGKK